MRKSRNIFDLDLPFIPLYDSGISDKDVYESDEESRPSIFDLLKKDYNELFLESSDLIYWESHVRLNKGLEEASNYTDLIPVELENIFEINEVSIQRTTNMLTGAMTELRKNELWMESWQIHPGDFELTLKDALKIYWNSNITRTTGDRVTMRRPLNPKYKHPLYILGKNNSPVYVSIDAVTGEISLIE